MNWWETPEGREKYKAAREIAQRDANADGCDRGLERNDVFKYFRVFRLPQKKNRFGFELRCEVVWPERLSNCQPGHGPL